MPDLSGKVRLEVHARLHYPSWNWRETRFSQEDRRANFQTLAIKGKTDKLKDRWQDLPVKDGQSTKHITNENLVEIQYAFAGWVADQCKRSGLKRPVFIPIPNRSAVDNNLDFQTARLADMIAKRFGDRATAWPNLRFRKPVPDSPDNRRIPPYKLYQYLHCYGRIPDGEVVLIDDVFTLGWHIAAAIKRLGIIPNKIFVGANTIKAPVRSVLSANTTQLDIDFDTFQISRV